MSLKPKSWKIEHGLGLWVLVKVSVITTCKESTDVREFREALDKQSFRDFELIMTHDERIPDGWNSGIEKARGEILVFTETDCLPTETWLAELVPEVEDGKIVRGAEILPGPLDMGNIGITRNTLAKHRFDRAFGPAEDTEFFARLMSDGVSVKQIQKAIVFHNKKRPIFRSMKLAFLQGKNHCRIYLRYGLVYRSWYHTFGRDTIIIFEHVLEMLGTLYGLIMYWRERSRR